MLAFILSRSEWLGTICRVLYVLKTVYTQYTSIVDPVSLEYRQSVLEFSI